MADRTADQANEEIGFWKSWRGLYAFVLVYGLLQIVLLYLFTLALNHT